MIKRMYRVYIIKSIRIDNCCVSTYQSISRQNKTLFFCTKIGHEASEDNKQVVWREAGRKK